MNFRIPERPDIPNHWSDSFFGPFFPKIFSILGKFESTKQDTRDLIKLFGMPVGSRVLDIPCGFGRFSYLLSKSGYVVTGVDASSYLLNIGRSKYPGPQYIQGDMRFPPSGPFDVVLNLWTSFGYFDNPDEDKVALFAWYHVLRPGGVLVMEITDLERAKFENPIMNSELTYKKRKVGEVIEEAWIDWSLQKATIRYSIYSKSFLGVTRIYSRNQLINLLNQVGFSSISCYGGFDSSPKLAENRLVIKAVK